MTHHDASDVSSVRILLNQLASTLHYSWSSSDMIFSLLTLLCLCSDPRLCRFLISLGINYASQSGHQELATNSVVRPEVMPVLEYPPYTDLIPGTYSYASSTNFESYLRQLGVAYWLRQLALLAHPVVTITAKNCSRPALEKVGTLLVQSGTHTGRFGE